MYVLVCFMVSVFLLASPPPSWEASSAVHLMRKTMPEPGIEV